INCHEYNLVGKSARQGDGPRRGQGLQHKDKTSSGYQISRTDSAQKNRPADCSLPLGTSTPIALRPRHTTARIISATRIVIIHVPPWPTPKQPSRTLWSIQRTGWT